MSKHYAGCPISSGPRPSLCPYAPECVEGAFCELRCSEAREVIQQRVPRPNSARKPYAARRRASVILAIFFSTFVHPSRTCNTEAEGKEFRPPPNPFVFRV